MSTTFGKLGGPRARRAAIAGAIALAFGAGAVTVYAIDPGGSDAIPAAVTASLTPRAIAPGISTGGDVAASRTAGGIQRGGDGAVNKSLPPATGGPASLNSYGKGGPGIAPGCLADISRVVSGSTIDPSGAGFQMNLLKSGFSLRSISVRGEGECDDKGVAKDPHVAVDSMWLHEGTQLDVSLSQRVLIKPRASVRVPGYAVFSAGGYLYTASANSNLMYYGGGPIPAEIAGAYPGGPGGPGADPRAAGVIDAMIAQLAPGFDKACFYEQKDGTWSDLRALGIGDPRPALPRGFTEQYSQFVVYTTPAANCNAPALAERGSFNASFVLGSGGKDGSGYLSVSAFALPAGQPPYPGYFDGYNANWSNGSFQFSVNGGGGGGGAGPGPGLGEDTIRAIATAMDPNFANACLMKNRQLTEQEFLALGYRAPVVPEAFKLENSQFNASELSANCKNLPEGIGNSVNANWHYTASTQDTFLDVSINHFAGASDKFGIGSISGYGLNWMDSKGTHYSVNGFTGRKQTLGQDVLIAIAKSIDPTLDVSKLDEQPEVPRPYIK